MQLSDFKFDGRKFVSSIPEHARMLDYEEMFFGRVVQEQANVTSAVGKAAMYLMYYALSAYLSDNKITPPKDLLNDLRRSYGLMPLAELKRMKMPDLSRLGTSKQSLRDTLPALLRWNRSVKENTRIPENERKLLTYALRIAKPGVSKSSVDGMERLAWVLSPDLGGKVSEYRHGAASGGNDKKASASGVVGAHTALKAKVKALGGTGFTLDLQHAATAKAKAPGKYKEYLAARTELRKQFEIDFRKLIIGNDNKPMDVVQAEKAMRDKGYELLFIPTKSMGFLGKVGLNSGKMALFTKGDALLSGNIAPGSKVKMNPGYKDGDADAPYYMTVQAPGAVTKGNRIYTVQQRKGAIVEKFQKADQLAAKLPSLTKRWMQDVKSTDEFQRMAGTAATILYLTGARVGSNASGMSSKKGVAGFGILNMRAKMAKVTATSIILTYPGKKGVMQKHVISVSKPAVKLIAANLKKYLTGKKPDAMLWSVPSLSGKKTIDLTYADFNRYIKSMGFTQGAHKLRHVRGTSLAKQLLEAIPWKPSKAATTLAKRKKEADTYMKDKILSKVADLLGHRTTTKTGETKPAWSTSINSYVQPDIVREWYAKNQLDVPSWVPARVTDE